MGPARSWGCRRLASRIFFIATNTAFCNYTICAEKIVEWITDCIGYVRKKNYSRIAPTPQAEEAWVAHVNEAGSHTLLTSTSLGSSGITFPGRLTLSYCMRAQRQPIGPSWRRLQRRVTRASSCGSDKEPSTIEGGHCAWPYSSGTRTRFQLQTRPDHCPFGKLPPPVLILVARPADRRRRNGNVTRTLLVVMVTIRKSASVRRAGSR